MSKLHDYFRKGMEAFLTDPTPDGIKPALQRLARDLKGYGELVYGYDARDNQLLLGTKITKLCGANKIPAAIREGSEDVVKLGAWDCDYPDEIVDFCQHMTDHRHDTSWQTSRARLWVSCHYTRFDRPDLAKALKAEFGMENSSSVRLHCIDTGIARLVELVRLLGGDPDVSCEGHPQGTYLRAVLTTPEAVDMFTSLCAMRDATVWKMEVSDSPFEKLVQNRERMFTIRVNRDAVGCYDDRDTILEESVALIEKQFGIAANTLPGDTDNLWLVNRDHN